MIPRTTTVHLTTTSLLMILSSLASAFLVPTHPTTTTTALNEVIEPLDADAIYFDQGAGGVRLAAESALKIYGSIQHAPGKADSQPVDMMRYTQLRQIMDDATAAAITQHSILASGQGVEFYKDPGQTTEKEVKYAPAEAVKDCLQSAGSAMQSTFLVFNFLGGDDLILGQVLEAAEELCKDLDIPTKCQVAFNSCCHASIPAGTCTVTVVNVNPENVGSSGVASGEVYLRDGVYYTLEEADINTAVA